MLERLSHFTKPFIWNQIFIVFLVEILKNKIAEALAEIPTSPIFSYVFPVEIRHLNNNFYT